MVLPSLQIIEENLAGTSTYFDLFRKFINILLCIPAVLAKTFHTNLIWNLNL